VNSNRFYVRTHDERGKTATHIYAASSYEEALEAHRNNPFAAKYQDRTAHATYRDNNQ
jgi:hypothetical protein